MSAAMDQLNASIAELQDAVDGAVAKLNVPPAPAGVPEADVAAAAQKVSDLAGTLKAAWTAPEPAPAT